MRKLKSAAEPRLSASEVRAIASGKYGETRKKASSATTRARRKQYSASKARKAAELRKQGMVPRQVWSAPAHWPAIMAEVERLNRE